MHTRNSYPNQQRYNIKQQPFNFKPSSQQFDSHLPEEQPDHNLDELNQRMLVMDCERSDPRELQGYLMDIVRTGIFPPSRQPFEKITQWKQFKEILEREKVKYGQQHLKYYIKHSQTQTFRGITALCKNCRTSHQQLQGKKKIVLTSNPRNKYFVIKYFDNKHNHVFVQTMKKNDRKNKDLIIKVQEELEKTPKNIRINDFIFHLAKKTDVTQSTIKSILYRIKSGISNLNQIKQRAKILNLDFQFMARVKEQSFWSKDQLEHMKDQPDILIFWHSKSDERFKKSGQICYLMYLDFKIKGIQDQNKKWDVLVISGLTLQFMYEPFFFVFVKISERSVSTTSKVLFRIFDKFQKIPKTLVTPSDDFYLDLFAQLSQQHKFSGMHIFDPVMQIDRIGQTLDRYEDLSYFKNVLLSRTKGDYLANIQKLMSKCPPTKNIRHNLNRVIRYAPKMIFGCIDSQEYTGIIFDYSANKIISDIIKQNLVKFAYRIEDGQSIFDSAKTTRQQENQSESNLSLKGTININYSNSQFQKLNYVKCVKTMMAIMAKSVPEVNNSSNYDLKPYENVVQIGDIVSIRRCLKANLLHVFGQQYGRTFYQDFYIKKGEGDAKVFYIVDRVQKSWYTVAPCGIYNQKGGIDKLVLKCNCLFSSKTGVPCSHQIQATMLARCSLYQLFRDDYKIQQRYRNAGRPKLTRRNTQK